jgi:hypothetical protein
LNLKWSFRKDKGRVDWGGKHPGLSIEPDEGKILLVASDRPEGRR